MTNRTRHNVLSVQLTDSLAKRLDAVCDRTLIARSAFVRKALENALDPKSGIESHIVLAAEKAAEELYNAEERANGGKS